jgi:hypothetical protein
VEGQLVFCELQALPQSILASVDSIKDIENTLDKLVDRGYLEHLPSHGHTAEMKGVCITVDGLMAIRKHVRPIAEAIRTKEDENTVDKFQTESSIKEELRRVSKIENMAEDEIISEIFKVVREMGYPAGISIVNEVIKNFHLIS